LSKPRIGIVIPACNEEACIGAVLEELLRVIDLDDFAVAIGVNNSSDGTAEIAGGYPVLVAQTTQRGYGYGCQAAIDLLNSQYPSVSAYIFFAGDGASDPNDVVRLAAAFESGYELVVGTRTRSSRNWRAMTLRHVAANFVLGLWCGLLTGRFFTDLGPMRLIERHLFEAMCLREMTFGWTIEAQVAAAQRRALIHEIPVRERLRIGGQQKVSGVNGRQTFAIGCRIVAAGLRTRLRHRTQSVETPALVRTAPAALEPAVISHRAAEELAAFSRS
jgi:glycosyltransferase involved in cell wall biosynthesis